MRESGIQKGIHRNPKGNPLTRFNFADLLLLMHVKREVYVFTFSIFVFVFILLFVIISVKCILLVILSTKLTFYFEQCYFTSVSTIDLLEVNLQDFSVPKHFVLHLVLHLMSFR